ADEARQGADAEFVQAGLRKQNEGGGAVAGLGGVAGGHGAAGVEDGAQLRQRRGGGVGARALVGGEGRFARHLPAGVVEGGLADRDGDTLGGEASFADGGEGVLVAAEGEGVRLLPRDLVTFGEVLGGGAHAEV